MHINFFNVCSTRQFWIWIASFLCWSSAAKPTRAEIVPDTTLPTNSTVKTSGNIREIEGGTQQGENLFHSFREFSFSVLTKETTGDTALFNHDLAVKNIITRVTGNLASYIDGMIKTIPNSTANLFFINPNGIIFGSNASLNIGGSFVGTTANSVKFADGKEFSAIASKTPPLLTVSVPLGLQFGEHSGDIINQSQASPDGAVNVLGLPVGLQVNSGKTLALLGSKVSLVGGNLTAPSGRIELGSVGAGFVRLHEIDKGYALGYAGVENFGDIEITGGALVDTSDYSSGAIQIQGRNITLSQGSLIFAIAFGATKNENIIINATESVKVSDGANIATATQGESQAADILITAKDTVELKATAFIGSQVCPFLTNCASVTGNGGNLTIDTRRLLLKDGGVIEASTFGAGKAGNVLVKATDSIDVIGETPGGEIPSGIFAQVAQDAIENPGDAGNITLETKRLTIQGGGQISTAARYGGNGGNLNINASDTIDVSGASPFATGSLIDSYRSGIFVSAQPGARGNVGTLNINTGVLTVEKGARITADNFGSGQATTQNLNVRKLVVRDGGEVRTGSFGEGAGGTLVINATDSVEVKGTGRIGENNISSTLLTRSEGAGRAGNLIINSDRLLVQDGAEVTVSSQSSGQAGNLEVTARTVKLDNQGKLTGQTASADGGNITLKLKESLILRRNSQISTSAGTAFAGGNGGKIEIDAPFIVAAPLENNDITANAFSGQGGSIKINATSIFGLVPRSREDIEQLLGTEDPTQLNPNQLATNDITAISQTNPSLNGIININTPDVDPSRGLVQLPANLLDASGQIAQSCNSSSTQRTSSLIITGRGGIAPSPIEPLREETVIADWINLDESSANQLNSSLTRNKPTISAVNIPKSPKIVEAQGWIIDAKGNIALVAQPTTGNPLHPWSSSTSCHAHD